MSTQSGNNQVSNQELAIAKETRSKSPSSPAPLEVKQRIMAQIRDEGMSVVEASRQSGYATKTIYNWLRNSVEATGTRTNLVLENNRLKRELEVAYALLGRATAEMKRSKN